MHKHKQSQCKRKVKHRKNLMGLIIFCITVCIVFMFAYYQNLRKEISVRQEWLETVLTREKKWILENQVIHINDQADSYGNHIMIAHGNEVYTLYAHCDSLLVTVGQEVSQGEQIAWSGATGNVTGPHLHFEVREGGSRFRVNNVDPLDWIMQ